MTKNEIMEALAAKGVEFNPEATKSELLELLETGIHDPELTGSTDGQIEMETLQTPETISVVLLTKFKMPLNPLIYDLEQEQVTMEKGQLVILHVDYKNLIESFKSNLVIV